MAKIEKIYGVPKANPVKKDDKIKIKKINKWKIY